MEVDGEVKKSVRSFIQEYHTALGRKQMAICAYVISNRDDYLEIVLESQPEVLYRNYLCPFDYYTIIDSVPILLYTGKFQIEKETEQAFLNKIDNELFRSRLASCGVRIEEGEPKITYNPLVSGYKIFTDTILRMDSVPNFGSYNPCFPLPTSKLKFELNSGG